MNDNLVTELKNTIKNLKLEILKKQDKLDSLIEQYQQLNNIDLEDKDDIIEN